MDDLFQILADGRRREILRHLAGGERSAGEVHQRQAEVTFGAISQHLKVLERAGLVSSRKAGRNRFYQANIEALLPLRQWLDWMWDHSLDRLKGLAEAETANAEKAVHHKDTKAQRPRTRSQRAKNKAVESSNDQQSRERSTPAGKVSRRARPRHRGAS